MLEATPSTIRLAATMLRLVGVLMSGISLWVGLYMAEKMHEILLTGPCFMAKHSNLLKLYSLQRITIFAQIDKFGQIISNMNVKLVSRTG